VKRVLRGASRSKLKHSIIIAKACALCCWWASETYQACPSWESSCQYADLQVFCSYNPETAECISIHTPYFECRSVYHIQHTMLIIPPSPYKNMKKWQYKVRNYLNIGQSLWLANEKMSFPFTGDLGGHCVLNKLQA
jgi:hypothetical protein